MRAGLLRVVPALLFASTFLASPAQSDVAAPAANPSPTADASTGTPPSDSTPVHRIGGPVSAPTLLHNVPPQYSEQARKAKVSGTVVITLIVDANGLPQNIRVVRGVGMGLDEKAIEAVQQYKFRPAMSSGKPVPVRLNIMVNFQVLNRTPTD